MTNKKIIILLFTVLFINSPLGSLENDNKKHGRAKIILEPIFNSGIYFYDSGADSQVTVLLVHGVGEDASNIWKGLVPELEKQYRVIYFDLPGFGISDKPNALYSPANYAALIKWIYDKYVNGPMYVIGHSMGGAISLWYAGTYPQSLQRLVLVDAAGILYRTAFTKSLAETKISKFDKFKLFTEEMDILAQFIETDLIDTTDLIVPKELSLILENSFLRSKLLRSPQKIASVALLYADFNIPLNNVKTPTSIIWGSSDPVAPLRTGKLLSYNIPGSSLNIMTGLGHNPMLEKPAEFNELVIKLLSSDTPEKPQISAPDKVNVKKAISYKNKENLVIDGEYSAVEITNCRNILLKNINAGSIRIINSSVEMENVLIESEKTALSVFDSIVEITGGTITGDSGISVSESKIDIAGVKIKAKNAAVQSISFNNSTVVFSVSRIDSKYSSRYIHDIVELTRDNPL